jgi:hypothetical protein
VLIGEVEAEAASRPLPADLEARVVQELAAEPELAWEAVLARTLARR